MTAVHSVFNDSCLFHYKRDEDREREAPNLPCEDGIRQYCCNDERSGLTVQLPAML